jgi:hypothetical protein
MSTKLRNIIKRKWKISKYLKNLKQTKQLNKEWIDIKKEWNIKWLNERV